MNPKPISKTIVLNDGREIIIETGKLAKQAQKGGITLVTSESVGRKKEEKIAPIKSDTDTRGRRFVFI